MQVFSLPGLEPVFRKQLSEALGFPWSWSPVSTQSQNLQRLCSVGRDGQVLLTGPAWEIARLAVADLGWLPAECCEVYDWEVAQAALAASAVTIKGWAFSKDALPANPTDLMYSSTLCLLSFVYNGCRKLASSKENATCS